MEEGKAASPSSSTTTPLAKSASATVTDAKDATTVVSQQQGGGGGDDGGAAKRKRRNRKRNKTPKIVYRKCGNETCIKEESAAEKFQQCARCGVAYCSRECQVVDWKHGHKERCVPLITTAVDNNNNTNTAPNTAPTPSTVSEEEQRRYLRELVRHFATHVSPFAVYGHRERGRGVLHFTTESPISLFHPSLPPSSTTLHPDTKKPMDRVISINYRTHQQLVEREQQKSSPVAADAGAGADVTSTSADSKGGWLDAVHKILGEYKPTSEFVVLLETGGDAGNQECHVWERFKLEPSLEACRRQTQQFTNVDDAIVVNLDRD